MSIIVVALSLGSRWASERAPNAPSGRCRPRRWGVGTGIGDPAGMWGAEAIQATRPLTRDISTNIPIDTKKKHKLCGLE